MSKSANFSAATSFYRRLIAAGNPPNTAATVYEEAIHNAKGFQRVLTALVPHTSPVRAGVLADEQGISLGVVTSSCYILWLCGLVERSGASQRYAYCLTEAGRAAIEHYLGKRKTYAAAQ